MTAPAAIESLLDPTLAALETTRADTVRQINRRLRSRVPLGLALAFGAWVLAQNGKQHAGLFDLLMFLASGAALGYFWASHKLAEQYRALYKAQVLPRLAAQFGALDWRPAATPDLGLLTANQIFQAYDAVVAEDEIFGTYRALPLSIVELKLTHGSGKQKRTVFDGLLTRVSLPRRLSGVTAVVADDGVFGNLRDRLMRAGRDRVRLEDPAFEKVYEVYGDDQIAARALLTPAFMERFLSLGERAGFLKPLALAHDSDLIIVLPKAGYDNLFEPPSYSQPAKSEAALTKLQADLAAVLRAADAVIDLDQASRSAAAQAASRSA